MLDDMLQERKRKIGEWYDTKLLKLVQMELLFEAGTLQLQSAVSFVGWILHTAALSTLPPTVQQRKFGTGSTASWVNNVIKLMFYPIQKDFMHKDFVSKRDVLETIFFSAMSK